MWFFITFACSKSILLQSALSRSISLVIRVNLEMWWCVILIFFIGWRLEHHSGNVIVRAADLVSSTIPSFMAWIFIFVVKEWNLWLLLPFVRWCLFSFDDNFGLGSSSSCCLLRIFVKHVNDLSAWYKTELIFVHTRGTLCRSTRGTYFFSHKLSKTSHAFLLNNIRSALLLHTFAVIICFISLHLLWTWNLRHRGIIVPIETSKVDLLSMQAIESLADLWISFHGLCKNWIRYFLNLIVWAIRRKNASRLLKITATRSIAKPSSPRTLQMPKF